MSYQDYLDTVQKYYIAYYQRPADPQGLRYWAEKLDAAGGAVGEIIESFANSDESKELYGDINSNNIENVISNIYQAALGRTPDSEGLQYYVDGFNNGDFTPASIMVNIADGAIGIDATVLQNKIEAAKTFTETLDPDLDLDADNDDVTYSGNTDAQLAREWLGKIKDTPSKPTEVYEYIKTNIADATDGIFRKTNPADTTSDIFDHIRENSLLKEYTTSSDEITGTEDNDYIDADAGNDTVEGLDGHDVIIGNIGDDTLYGGYGRDQMEGGFGADTLYAGSDSYGSEYDSEFVSDYYDENYNWIPGYTKYTVDVWAEDLNGGGGADHLYGGYGSDILNGGEGDDYIKGDIGYFNYYDEDDIVLFSNGDTFDEDLMYNDTIYGGDGNDLIYGDYTYGYYGDDYIEGGDGNDTIYAGEGADTVIAGAGDDDVDADGADNIDLGDGNDEIGYTLVDGEHGVMVAGEGSDYLKIYMDYDSNGEGMVTIDLTEETAMKDTVYIDQNPEPLTPVEIESFDLTMDKLDIDSFDLYGTDGDNAYGGQSWSYDDTTLYRNYIQIVDSTTTEWQTRAENPSSSNPEDDGKGIFVIQGASVAESNKYTVAEFLDDYGNNATYGKSDSHYFIVNIENTGMGIYKFVDDTGGDDYLHGDELTPVATLVGTYTEDIDLMTSADFIV